MRAGELSSVGKSCSGDGVETWKSCAGTWKCAFALDVCVVRADGKAVCQAESREVKPEWADSQIVARDGSCSARSACFPAV